MNYFSQDIFFIFTLSSALIISIAGHINHDAVADVIGVTNSNLGKLKNIPDSMDFDIFVEKKNITLKLKRNKNIEKASSCFSIRRDATGNEVLVKEHLQFEANVGLYQDVSNGAAISVKCKGLESGVCDSTLTGTVFLDGEEFNIRVLQHASTTEQTPPRNRLLNKRRQYNLTKKEKHKVIKTDFTAAGKTLPRGQLDRNIMEPVEPTLRTSIPLLEVAPEINANNAEILGQTVVNTAKNSAAVTDKSNNIARRNKVKPYNLELLVVIDYSIYRRFYEDEVNGTEHEKSINAKSAARAYFDQVINGVDVRFKSLKSSTYEINVAVSAYIYADSPGYPAWNIEPSLTPDTRRPMDANQTIYRLGNWRNMTTLPNHDHLILFTDNDLYIGDPTSSEALLVNGYAFVGEICTNRSISTVEDHGAFDSVLTATHEIAHSFGLHHDGEVNNCLAEDQFLMTNVGGVIDEGNKFNPWKFSPCSIREISDHIGALESSGKNCLLTDALMFDEEEFNRNTAEHPGQTLDPNGQCKALVDDDSYYGWGGKLREFEDICTHMACKTKKDANSYRFHNAARGTSCGDKKWCMDGTCTLSRFAEPKMPNCVHGNSLRFFPEFANQTCTEIISAFPGLCYDDFYREVCCGSCAQEAMGRPADCQYGDYAMSCANLVNTPHLCYTNDMRCCESCAPLKTGPPGCEYYDKQQDCEPRYCQDIPGNEPYRESCCHTCGLTRISAQNIVADPITTTTTMTTTTTTLPTATTSTTTTPTPAPIQVQEFQVGNNVLPWEVDRFLQQNPALQRDPTNTDPLTTIRPPLAINPGPPNRRNNLPTDNLFNQLLAERRGSPLPNEPGVDLTRQQGTDVNPGPPNRRNNLPTDNLFNRRVAERRGSPVPNEPGVDLTRQQGTDVNPGPPNRRNNLPTDNLFNRRVAERRGSPVPNEPGVDLTRRQGTNVNPGPPNRRNNLPSDNLFNRRVAERRGSPVPNEPGVELTRQQRTNVNPGPPNRRNNLPTDNPFNSRVAERMRLPVPNEPGVDLTRPQGTNLLPTDTGTVPGVGTIVASRGDCVNRNASFGVVSCSSLLELSNDICRTGSPDIRGSCCMPCPAAAVPLPVDTCIDSPTCNIRMARECYRKNEKCCATCRRFNTGLQGCEYGNRRKNCGRYFRQFPEYVCTRIRDECCETCKDIPEKPSTKPKRPKVQRKQQRGRTRGNRFMNRFKLRKNRRNRRKRPQNVRQL